MLAMGNLWLLEDDHELSDNRIHIEPHEGISLDLSVSSLQ